MAFHRVEAEELASLQSEDAEAGAARSLELSTGAEQRSATKGRGWPLIAVVLALGAVLAFATRAGTKVEADATPRLLESDELLDALVDHAVRFHSEAAAGGESGGEAGVPRQTLKAAAHREVQDVLARVSKESPAAGRSLASLKLSGEQWAQTQRLLEALHDRRVHELGEFVQQELGQSKDPEEARARVAAREAKIRELRAVLIPADLHMPRMMHAEKTAWGLDVHDGGFKAAGTVHGWHGSLEVGGASSESSRRLMGKGETIYMWLASVAAVIVGIATTIMTVIFHGALAENMWLIAAGSAGLLCGGTGFIGASPGLAAATMHTIAGGLWGIIGGAIGGLKGHFPQFGDRSLGNQIPCFIMTSFTGLEAIWVFAPKAAAAVAQ